MLASFDFKDKEYYINVYKKCLDYCQRVTEARGEEDSFVLFNEICNAEEIVGYYLDTYGNDAQHAWLDNIRDTELNTVQLEVDRVLTKLFH